ncbi:MAG: ABC transporter ATP-binding protein [Arenicellales bacterium]|jgi:branched-chain amino acid transport system ATP-binding protein|nr:ABC transporter ATP-binding protein [Arenicellales bacterium]|tara:strand:- start:2726 stop:3460 length:735 start_codon:yes stop_codon:yes gene_type:complete
MGNTVALSIRNVTKNFGGLVAVDNMSFDIKEREVVGLIGPNGSGKTTMLNLISGELKPGSGHIRVFGREISGRPAHRIARHGVARTFQLIKILPSMTVMENVAAGGVFGYRRYWGAKLNRRVKYLIQHVGLGGKEQMPVVALTYIDQKRVELARALISDPKLLLLDEWLAGLNPAEMKVGINLVSGLRYEGRTIVVVEHFMDAIRSLCDRCIVMNSGAKIAEGSPEDALNDPEVVRAYLGDDNA